MNVEERLRAALHGTADLVEDRPRPLPAARRSRPWLVPAWSALVVALVMAVPFALPEREPARPVPMSSPSLAIGAAPKTYVAVYRAKGGEGSRFEIRSTATGEVLETNHAVPGESFVAIAPIPEDEEKEVGHFYLLARTAQGTSPGCAKYSIYRLRISVEDGFSSWGSTSLNFEAADEVPMTMATTRRGDEIAYSYRDCKEGDGGWRISHRWAGTTTIWTTMDGQMVRNLAYSPDGQTLAAFLRGTETEEGGPPSELRLTRVGNPHSGFTDETENDSVLSTDEDFSFSTHDTKKDVVLPPDQPLSLVNAMITPDWKKIIALFGSSQRTAAGYTIEEFPLAQGTPRPLGSLRPSTDRPANLDVLMKQHPSGPELLFQIADGTFLRGARPEGAVVASGTAPDDLAW